MRSTSYGQQRPLSALDRLGVYLSGRQIRHAVGDVSALRVADLGCGYEARFATSLLDVVSEMVLVDVAISPKLRSVPAVRAVEGTLPEALAMLESASVDVALCISVLEHLADPLGTLQEIHRILAPGGTAVLNVPTWFGKRFLELSAFRLGLSPFEEMDDHKNYYDPRDLWPLLVSAGFRPHNISCRRHKFAMNTFAVCRMDRAVSHIGSSEPGTRLRRALSRVRAK